MTLGLLGVVFVLFAVLAGLPRVLNATEARRHKAALRALGDGFPIIIPVCDRPDYLAKTLDGLRGVADIAQTTLVFTQDERHPEIAAQIAGCGLRHVHLRHTQPFFAWLARSGLTTRTHCIGSNIYFAVQTVFAHSQCRGVIVLEDDLVPSVNFYRHFVWCFEHLMLHPERAHRVLTCGAYNRYSKGQIPAHEHDALFCDQDYFSPWSWAMARERWASVRGLWSFASWDSGLEGRAMPCLGLVNYRSVHSHVQSIGHRGVNGNRAQACTFYTTAPVQVPIDYAALQPRFYEDGLPEAYWHPLRDLQQQADPDHPSEWERKLLPRLWAPIQRAWPAEKRRAIKRWLPFC